jgi:hypothetical protein
MSQKATVVAYAVHPRVPAREIVGLDFGEAKTRGSAGKLLRR